MPRVHLVIDVDNLMHRYHYAFPPLLVDGNPTGATHGFLRAVLSLREEFSATDLVFCFDRGEPVRKKLFPAYKANHKDDATEPYKQKKYLHRQLHELRNNLLPMIGFRNVFSQDGYEADDFVAAVCNHWQVRRAVIVSSDKDLHQCLCDTPAKYVTQYDLNGNGELSKAKFIERYGVYPSEWVQVKAMMGDVGDNIPGIEGVGEKTAIKWLKFGLAEHTKACQGINAGKDVIARNRELMELPYPGLRPVELREDDVTVDSWRAALDEINASHLVM